MYGDHYTGSMRDNNTCTCPDFTARIQVGFRMRFDLWNLHLLSNKNKLSLASLKVNQTTQPYSHCFCDNILTICDGPKIHRYLMLKVATNVRSRLGLGVWFFLRVEEVPGSIPGADLFGWIFCTRLPRLCLTFIASYAVTFVWSSCFELFDIHQSVFTFYILKSQKCLF